MSSYRICKACGEYEHDCNCAAGKIIKMLKKDRDRLQEQVRSYEMALKRIRDLDYRDYRGNRSPESIYAGEVLKTEYDEDPALPGGV